MGVIMHTYKNENGCFSDDKEFMGKQAAIFIKEMSISETLSGMNAFGKIVLHDVELFLGNEKVIQELKKLDFDLCILDGIFHTVFFHILPYRLDIPAVSFLAVFNPNDAGIPGLPSFTPYVNMGKSTNEMTFLERVVNMLMTTILDSMFSLASPSASNGLISKYAPDKPYISMKDLQKRASLWLVMTDVAMDYPQVRMPHVVDVGGLNTKPAKPLPQELQDIAEKATNGIIIVSFGSYATSFPEATIRNLMEAFKQLNQTIIWGIGQIPEATIPPHVHLLKWIPQNDLLGHPNTKLFITHCGANGQFEALYHAVPMLGLPLFGDQVYNSLRMAKKGLGIHMALFKSTPAELVSSISELLTNTSYQSTMAMHSAIFKDRPMKPMETLVYWVEHVMKHGSDHLVSPAIHLPWYTYWCLDVSLFFVIVGFMFTYCSYRFLKGVCRCLCKSKQNKLKSQ